MSRASKRNTAEQVDVDRKLELLEFSYKEVLDATKHQEDKISRLLTAIAFITASALALANFGTISKAVERQYSLGGTHLPLAAITVGLFLIGVVATVVILLSSITTPLRLPGAQRGVEDRTPHIEYANENVKGSQIYFYEISRFSPDEWNTKWQSDVAALRRERRDALKVETHNLAVRTRFKYERMNEAVAVLSFALFSFALSAVLVLVAVVHPTDGVDAPPVDLNLTARLTLAVVIFGYVWLQLFVSAREQILTVHELDGVSLAQTKLGRWAFAATRLAFPLAAALVPALLAAVELPNAVSALWIVAVPSAIAWCMFAYITVRAVDSRRTASQAERSSADDLGRTTPRKLRVLTWTAAIALSYAGVALWAVYAQSYAIQFTAACLSALILLVASLTTGVTSRRRLLVDYRNRGH